MSVWNFQYICLWNDVPTNQISTVAYFFRTLRFNDAHEANGANYYYLLELNLSTFKVVKKYINWLSQRGKWFSICEAICQVKKTDENFAIFTSYGFKDDRINVRLPVVGLLKLELMANRSENIIGAIIAYSSLRIFKWLPFISLCRQQIFIHRNERGKMQNGWYIYTVTAILYWPKL